MTEHLHPDDLIIQYIDGELSNAERVQFEMEIMRNTLLFAKVQDLKIATQAVKQAGIAQSVADVHTAMMGELKSKPARVVNFKKALRYSMAIAASLVVLYVGINFYNSARLTPEILFNEAYVEMHFNSTRGVVNEVSAIEKLYEQKNYQAITTATHTLQQSAKDSFLTGLANLHLQKTNSAINWLRPLTVNENEWSDDATFYLALAYLRNKNYDQSIRLLTDIRNEAGHMYQQNVSNDLIEKVKKLQAK